MATIKEFTALRPGKDVVTKVATLPYDVVTAQQAKKIAEDNPCSFFHVTRPEIDLPLSTNPYSDEVYKLGKKNLSKFIADGILVRDDKPYVYLYTLQIDNHKQTGIVAVVSIDDYINGIVKKHELTRKVKETDRMNHINIVGAQTGLVYLFYRDSNYLQNIMHNALSSPVLYDFVADDGVRHIIQRIEDDDYTQLVKQAFDDQILYIADGHHRAASSVRVGLQRREQGYTGSEPFNYFIAAIFPHSELNILPYNRVVKDLNNHDFETFMRLLSDSFVVQKADGGIAKNRQEIRMYYDHQWYALTFIKKLPINAVDALNVSILQNTILSPILGIKDPREDVRIDFVGGNNAITTMVELVDSGSYVLGFSLFPTSIDELMTISDRGEIMPPKSTWFEPKLRDGLLVYCID